MPKLRTKERYFTKQQFMACEENFVEALDHMADRYQQLVQPETGLPPRIPGSSNSSFGVSRTTPPLPRISLPKFNREFIEWETFRDHFRSVIDNADLPDITRMQYLLSCLKGEASDLIKTLPITKTNFKVAWKVLLSRYDNHRGLVQEHIHALHSLSNIHSKSESELITLRD